jgi:hypothetical protein
VIIKKILALALPLMFLTFLAIPAGNATVTPVKVRRVKVRRVKDVCFITVRGDHHTSKFLFHYDNLSPSSQAVHAEFKPQSGLWFTISLTIIEGGSMDVSATGDYGMTMSFQITVDGENVLQDTIVIPPPR